MRKRILFICTHNSARSQMAEGLTNHFFGDRWVGFSAGTEQTRVKPMALKAMERAGIDISHHHSKLTTDFEGETFDMVVTVCDSAKETCPFFPGTENLIHKSFTDPSGTDGTDEEILAAFCRTRDEIHSWLKELLA